MRSNHSKRTFFNFGSLSDMFVNVQSSYFCVRVFLFFNKSNKNLDPAKKKGKFYVVWDPSWLYFGIFL
jgi:hypothetical protein